MSNAILLRWRTDNGSFCKIVHRDTEKKIKFLLNTYIVILIDVFSSYFHLIEFSK